MKYKLSDCVRLPDGRIVCWDCVIKHLVELTLKPIEAKDLPKEALEKFIANLAGEGEND